MRRCLAMIRRVQRGPTDLRGLVKTVLEAEGEEAYGSSQELMSPDLVHDDLARIRNNLYVNIRADPVTREYAIQELDRPLLDLPDEDLATIAWLQQTFNPNSPRHREVWGLLERLRFYLAPERRLKIEQQRTALVLELAQQDDDRISAEVELKLQEALARRLQVEFDYLSPQNETGQSRRHVVDVFEPPRFEPTLGHYYLRGWCHYNVGPEDRFDVGAYVPYRLGRVSNLHFTSSRLPPSPPKARRYTVEYWLSAQIARQGVTRRRWIDIETIEQQTNKEVMVRGFTDDIFFAVQELMHYRYHCRVLGGLELLEQMTETVRKMAELYQQKESDTVNSG